MDIWIERVAGLDVSKRDVKVCVRTPSPRRGRRHSQVRTFSTMDRDLAEMAGWLRDLRVGLAVMESTGPYWKPVYYALERAGFTHGMPSPDSGSGSDSGSDSDSDCDSGSGSGCDGWVDPGRVWLVNARSVKGVPGRKSDVQDCQWLAQLAEHGLVKPSFVPPPLIRRLRDLTRERTRLGRDRTRVKQRLLAVLEDAGIKLDVIASDVFGVSGRSMLAALIEGERDPVVLAELARRRLRAKIPILVDALTGHFTDHHARQCRRLLTRLDFLTGQINDLTTDIDTLLTSDTKLAHARALLIKTPGISTTIAEVILAETGGDMTRFATPGHLTSWAGLAPGIHQSGHHRKPVATRKGNTWLTSALTEAAAAASRTRTWLAARYHRIAARRGTKRALIASARALLEGIWHMLTHNQPWHDLGPHHYTQRHNNRTRRLRRLQHEAHALGLTLTNPHQPQPTTPA